jgi:hypothetical protein
MAQKRFGPTLDAGTVIIEKDADKTIQAHTLGSTAYVGVLERGKVGDLIITSGKKDLYAKTGGLTPDSLLPDVCQDFWDHSGGAGVLFLDRIDDGSGVVSTLTLWDRKTPRNKVIRVDANNVGKWGGKKDTVVVDLTTVPTDITNTVITLPTGFLVPKNKWKGGQLTLTGASKTYSIVSNTEGTASVRCEITLAADSKALTDFGISTDKEVILVLENTDEWGREKKLAVEVMDGQLKPSTEWGLKIYVDDALVKTYPDLSSNPAAANYYVEVVNKDTSNYYVIVTDLWSGASTADVRPANWFGVVDDGMITSNIAALSTACIKVDSSLASDNTLTAFTFGSKVIPDTYVLEVTNAGPPAVWKLSSVSKQTSHTFAIPTDAVPYVADNVYSIGFTVSGTTPVVGEKFTIYVLPLITDEAINGKIILPDVSTAPKGGFSISDNAVTQVNIGSGDLTCGGTLAGDIKVRLQYRQTLSGGYDGIYKLDSVDFTDVFAAETSPFNKTQDQAYGLIKLGVPGVWKYGGSVDATVVQKAGVAYADDKNHQFRAEIQDTVTDEFVAKAYVTDTLGRSNYEKVIFPSYATVADPIKEGLLKVVPVMGMVHGREAKTAKDYNGYHKVAAGIYTTLPKIKEIPTGDTKLNGEVLNPAGLQRIERKQGNFVIWGARLPSQDNAWKFCQQRELMSYYEHVLQESFDWVIFAINDPSEQPMLMSTLQSFFTAEWKKRALRGATFNDACKIKLDDENNTDATRAAGDLNVEISLQLADTVERFIITVGKMGIFEASAAA